MSLQLSEIEVRVLGALVEKEITTPEYYPLSLNALLNACNQKSNRDPVLTLNENDVRQALCSLFGQALARSAGGDSRVPKYEHRLNELYNLHRHEIAVLCILLLRGPQTPGELRTRAARMASFSEVGEVESALESLSSRADGPFVVRLPREPGRRDSRYAHLFGGVVSIPAPTEESSSDASMSSMSVTSRLERLEDEVRQLKEELKDIKTRLAPQ